MNYSLSLVDVVSGITSEAISAAGAGFVEQFSARRGHLLVRLAEAAVKCSRHIRPRWF